MSALCAHCRSQPAGWAQRAKGTARVPWPQRVGGRVRQRRGLADVAGRPRQPAGGDGEAAVAEQQRGVLTAAACGK